MQKGSCGTSREPRDRDWGHECRRQGREKKWGGKVSAAGRRLCAMLRAAARGVSSPSDGPRKSSAGRRRSHTAARRTTWPRQRLLLLPRLSPLVFSKKPVETKDVGRRAWGSSGVRFTPPSGGVHDPAASLVCLSCESAVASVSRYFSRLRNAARRSHHREFHLVLRRLLPPPPN